MSITWLVRFVLGVLLVVGLTACLDARRPLPSTDDKADKKDKAEKVSERADLNDLNHEVTVLQVLTNLQATRPQMKALTDLARTTAPKPGPRKLIKVTDKYYRALVALRDALVEGDDEKINESAGALEEARDGEEPDFEDVEITDEARKEAPALLKKFTARQVTNYLIPTADDFPEPGEQLTAALEKSRELKGKDWRELRDDSAYMIGWLLAGVDEVAEKKVRDQVTALLNKAQALDDKAYDEQRADLEKGVQEIIGKVGPTDVLRNYMERTLAEILSNPRLVAAVEGRIKKGK